MTDSEKDFVRSVRMAAGRLTGKNLNRALKAVCFSVIGEGCYKTALAHPSWPELIVKTYRIRGSWYYDEVMVAPVPKVLEPFWLPFLFVCRRFVIQHRAASCNEKATKYFNRIFEGEYDLGEWNVGMYQGKPRIFDYGLPAKDRARLPKFRVLHFN